MGSIPACDSREIGKSDFEGPLSPMAVGQRLEHWALSGAACGQKLPPGNQSTIDIPTDSASPGRCGTSNAFHLGTNPRIAPTSHSA